MTSSRDAPVCFCLYGNVLHEQLALTVIFFGMLDSLD